MDSVHIALHREVVDVEFVGVLSEAKQHEGGALGQKLGILQSASVGPSLRGAGASVSAKGSAW